MRTRLYGGVGGEFRKILPYPDIQDLPVICEGRDPALHFSARRLKCQRQAIADQHFSSY